MDKQYNKIVIFLNTNLKSMKVFWFVLASKQKKMRKTWMMGYLDLGEIWSFCMFCCWPWEGRDPVPNLFCIFHFVFGNQFWWEDIFHHQILDWGWRGRRGGEIPK